MTKLQQLPLCNKGGKIKRPQNKRKNLQRGPLFCKCNGYETIATFQISHCLIPENRIWMLIEALVESEGQIFRNENARNLHHC
jgi:hypothetical protein